MEKGGGLSVGAWVLAKGAGDYGSRTTARVSA